MDDKHANLTPVNVRVFFLLVKYIVVRVDKNPKTASTDIVIINLFDERLTVTVAGELESARGTFEPNTMEMIAPTMSVEQTIRSIRRTGSESMSADNSNDQTIVNVANEDATACPHRENTASEIIADRAIKATPATHRTSNEPFLSSLL
jgi:hypothetical protein